MRGVEGHEALMAQRTALASKMHALVLTQTRFQDTRIGNLRPEVCPQPVQPSRERVPSNPHPPW